MRNEPSAKTDFVLRLVIVGRVKRRNELSTARTLKLMCSWVKLVKDQEKSFYVRLLMNRSEKRNFFSYGIISIHQLVFTYLIFLFC